MTRREGEITDLLLVLPPLLIGPYIGRYPLPWFLFFGPPVRGLSFGPWRTSAFHVGSLFNLASELPFSFSGSRERLRQIAGGMRAERPTPGRHFHGGRAMFLVAVSGGMAAGD
jgi:hypothetical protein